jgi:hypothetical protein
MLCQQLQELQVELHPVDLQVVGAEEEAVAPLDNQDIGENLENIKRYG